MYDDFDDIQCEDYYNEDDIWPVDPGEDDFDSDIDLDTDDNVDHLHAVIDQIDRFFTADGGLTAEAQLLLAEIDSEGGFV